MVVNARRKCKIKSLRIYACGSECTGKVMAPSFKKKKISINGLPVTPVRHSSCMVDRVEPIWWRRTEGKSDEAHPLHPSGERIP